MFQSIGDESQDFIISIKVLLEIGPIVINLMILGSPAIAKFLLFKALFS
jgi:hypothetical protein